MHYDRFKIRYVVTKYLAHPLLYRLKDHLIHSNKLRNFFFNHGFVALITAGVFAILLSMALAAGSQHAYYIPKDLTGISILVAAMGYLYNNTKDRIANDEDAVEKALFELMNAARDSSNIEIILEMELNIS